MSSRQFYVSEEERKYADIFFGIYEQYGYQGTKDTNRQDARKLRENVLQCRFCKKDRKETKFTQDTHLIPKLLGQNTYYSHDECDECNQRFQRFESDLSHYLGTTRVFNHFRTDVSAPGFRSGNGAVKVKNYGNDFIYVENTEPEKGNFNIDLQSGTAEIKMETSRYIPRHVYRVLLKIALGCLRETDVPMYDDAFRFLLNPERFPDAGSVKEVIITETDLTIGRPFAFIFKKRNRDETTDLPAQVFCLYAGNRMFQLGIPDQSGLFSGHKQAQIPWAPYVQLDADHSVDNIVRIRYKEDLSSTAEETKDQSIRMKFPTDNLVAINPGFDMKEFLDDLKRKKSNGK